MRWDRPRTRGWNWKAVKSHVALCFSSPVFLYLCGFILNFFFEKESLCICVLLKSSRPCGVCCITSHGHRNYQCVLITDFCKGVWLARFGSAVHPGTVRFVQGSDINKLSCRLWRDNCIVRGKEPSAAEYIPQTCSLTHSSWKSALSKRSWKMCVRHPACSSVFPRV